MAVAGAVVVQPARTDESNRRAAQDESEADLDPATALIELQSRLDRLDSNPDPSVVDEVFAPDSPHLEPARMGYAASREAGLAMEAHKTRIVEVEETERPTERLSVIWAVTAVEKVDVVDAQGTTVAAHERLTPGARLYTLARDAGVWRIYDWVELGDWGAE